MSRYYPNLQSSSPPPIYFDNARQYRSAAASPPGYASANAMAAPSYQAPYASTMQKHNSHPTFNAPPPTYGNNMPQPAYQYPNVVPNMARPQYQQMPPTYASAPQVAAVNVVPFVVPALTPAASSAIAAIKPSHQILIVKPLPAFLTEDGDLLTLAKQFVIPAEQADQEAAHVQRILMDGDEAVLARIREIKNEKATQQAPSLQMNSTNEASTNPKPSLSEPQLHCNYLPFAAKVIRKSVLSAVTAALQRQQQQLKGSASLSPTDLAETLKEASTSCGPAVMPNAQCFCEEGYGFLLFATEEAGLTYLRAAEKLARQDESGGIHSDGLGLRPSNVTAVRRDYDEINQIKMRIYEDATANDDDDNLNASFSSSISSSSCDSATSFDSQSSFESLASDIDEECEENKVDNVNNATKKELTHEPQVVPDCDHCTVSRRMYRTYYRAKMNKRINAVKIRCGVIVESNERDTMNVSRRPTTFNGVPLASKEHIAEMRSLFSNCFFNTVLSVAGADGTVSAKPKPKAARLSLSGNLPESLVEGAPSASTASIPPTPQKIVVHRPVLIDCTDGQKPSISFMRARNVTHDDQPTSTVMSLISEDLTKFATAIATSTRGVDGKATETKVHPHHTHHRHCKEHRAAASAKRFEYRQNKALQSKILSRNQPHVVNMTIPLSNSSQNYRSQQALPPAYHPPAVVTANPIEQNVEPLLNIEDFPAERSTTTLICASPAASTTMYPTHSATNSISFVGDADVSTAYASCSSPTPTVTRCASPSATVAVAVSGQRRFRHNPYATSTTQAPVAAPSPVPTTIVEPTTCEPSTVKPVAISTSVANAPALSSASVVSREPSQNHHQGAAMPPQQVGLAAYLPSWAQNGGTGLQDAANNASARLRNMLSMSKVKRF